MCDFLRSITSIGVTQLESRSVSILVGDFHRAKVSSVGLGKTSLTGGRGRGYPASGLDHLGLCRGKMYS